MSPRAKGGLVAVTVVVKADPTLSWMARMATLLGSRKMFFFGWKPGRWGNPTSHNKIAIGLLGQRAFPGSSWKQSHEIPLNPINILRTSNCIPWKPVKSRWIPSTFYWYLYKSHEIPLIPIKIRLKSNELPWNRIIFLWKSKKSYEIPLNLIHSSSFLWKSQWIPPEVTMSTQGLWGPNGFAQLFGAIGPVKGLTGDFPSKIGDFLVLYPLVN
jgi:hypothetical protein